jgi:hypothetical protein
MPKQQAADPADAGSALRRRHKAGGYDWPKSTSYVVDYGQGGFSRRAAKYIKVILFSQIANA